MKTLIKSISIVLCSMIMATAFTACGDGDDSGGSVNNGGSTDDTQITKSKLVGTWQAISAKGIFTKGSYNRRPIDTKEIYGLDSLDTPPLIIINSDGTFESYVANLSNYRYINGISYPFSYSWRKQGPKGGSGEGTYLLVGNQIQLNDKAGSTYSINATITSLTNDRLILQSVISDGENYENVNITYSRDGNGADYFTYPYVNRNIKYAGDWILTSCDNETGALGSTFTFNSDGTGYFKLPNDNESINFTFNLASTGEFTIFFDNVWYNKGMIHIDDTKATGYYMDGNKYVYFTFTRKM